MTGLKKSRWILRAAIVVASWLALARGAVFAEDGGQVLPPTATPHGYSLTHMARAIALFQTSGNSSEHYPDTPFQVLAEDTTTVVVPPSNGGIVVTGGNSFTVSAGTPFYVPIFYTDDSPPIEGTFPTSARTAPAYVFDHSQVGCKDFAIIVDGKSTTIHRD